VIGPKQWPLPDSTQKSQQTDIRVPGGIRTHDLRMRAAVDLHVRPRGHWDRQCKTLGQLNSKELNESYWEMWCRYLEVIHKTLNKFIKSRKRRKCRTQKPHRHSIKWIIWGTSGKNNFQLHWHLTLNTTEIMQTVVLGPELCEIDKKQLKQKICVLRKHWAGYKWLKKKHKTNTDIHILFLFHSILLFFNNYDCFLSPIMRLN